MGRLDGKVALVTGGGSGIGRGIGRAFAREGASLTLAGRRPEPLSDAAAEFAGMGAEVQATPTDVTDEDQVRALFEAALGRFGRLDILVNNAGMSAGGPLEDLSLEAWRSVIDLNLTGVFLCTREAMAIMKRQGGGRIINIGSISAQMPRMNSAPYTTSKHGLVGLTKSTALEGRAHGISAGCLHPGNTLTDMGQAIPGEEPMMETDDLAEVALAMAALPGHVTALEAIVLPYTQDYLGRG